MKIKQGVMILAATGMTGERKNFLLAITIAPTENEVNWLWFLEHLLQAIPWINSPKVVITSDRNKGLKVALKQVTPFATTCICLRHLRRSM